MFWLGLGYWFYWVFDPYRLYTCTFIKIILRGFDLEWKNIYSIFIPTSLEADHYNVFTYLLMKESTFIYFLIWLIPKRTRFRFFKIQFLSQQQTTKIPDQYTSNFVRKGIKTIKYGWGSIICGVSSNKKIASSPDCCARMFQ